MNFKMFCFSVTASILLVTKEIESSRQKAPDMKPIRNHYAELLNSLVNLNVDRVDALKKLLKLYDVKGVNHLSRAAEDEEDAKPDEVIVFHSSGKYPKIDKLIGNANKRLCTCQEVSSQFYNSDDFVEYAKSQQNPITAENLYFFQDNPETDRVFFKSRDKQFSNEGNNPSDSTSEEQFSKPLKGLIRRSKAKPCITPIRGYKDCKTACEETLKRVCDNYSCGTRVENYILIQCQQNCERRFLEDEIMTNKSNNT